MLVTLMAKGLRKKKMHPNYFMQVRLRAGAASHQMHRMHSEQGVFDIDLLLFLLNCICLVVVFVLFESHVPVPPLVTAQ